MEIAPTPPTHYTSAEGHQRLMAWYDAQLATLAVPYTSHRVDTRYGRTHVIATGKLDAPVVVLLHGINVNAAVWLPQMIALADEYRVIAPDLPGFAGKSSPTRIPYGQNDYANWLADSLDALNINRAVVVGGSAGGYFALQFAAYYPQRTVAALVMNPCGLSPYRHVYKLTRFPAFIRLLSIARPLIAHPVIAKRVVQRAMQPGTQASPSNIELSYLLLRYFKRHHPPPILTDDELDRITAPVIVMSSEHEIYTDPHATMQRARRSLPNLLEAQYIRDAGHDINKECPQHVNAAIRQLVRLPTQLSR